MSRKFDMIEWLKEAAETATLEGYNDEYEAVHQVIAFIESLPQDLVASFTPDLPTLEEAAKIYNESVRFYGSDWVVGDDQDSIIGPPELGSHERRVDGLEARLRAGAALRDERKIMEKQ